MKDTTINCTYFFKLKTKNLNQSSSVSEKKCKKIMSQENNIVINNFLFRKYEINNPFNVNFR